MAPQQDPISVRTSRLNNLLIGKSPASGVLSKAAIGRRSVFVGTASGSTSAFGNAIAEIVNRESLLDAFMLLYNECDKDALKKKDRQISEFVNKYRSVVEDTRHLRVNLEDFSVKEMIGKGYYGKVHLVVERQTSDVYAMKKIKKTVVTTSQVKEERDIMSRRCSEWITNLQYAFQDKDNLYLVMEFLPGGDLLGLMTRHGPFDEDLARFYLAELTLAIHTLHTMGYAHRDIKPDNILIDRFGHIKLADFGSAAALDRDGHVHSLTPVGTPDYIAPELLQTISTYKLTKSKHDVSCDFWSMGIIGYELIYETTPFHEENIHETYSKILSHCEENRHTKEIITFPTEQKTSSQFQDLIRSLVTNPTSRLSYDNIRKHQFFETIQWEKVRSQVPPIIPTVKSEDDTLNFDIDNATRNKARTSTFLKKSLSSDVKTNDFCGKDLPFIGYSFVHFEKPFTTTIDDSDDARFVSKSNAKINDLQNKLKERSDEIISLKQELLRAEQLTHQSDTRSKILQETKDEVTKMKNIIRDKTLEIAACHTKIKTLQKSVEVEAKMWEEKEATITDLLRKNRQKFEEAKIASEQRYEKQIAEKRHELETLAQKLSARETELTAKNEDLEHLQEKMKSYKEMVRQFKEQVQVERTEFEKNKMQLTEFYEEKLTELRNKLRLEKDNKCRLTMELRDMRSELDDSLSSTKLTHEAKKAADKSNDEILKRLNSEIEANNKLHIENVQLESKLSESQRMVQELQQEMARIERELQVAECSKNLAESALADQQGSPYETAPGSLTELHAIEEQLRADLETAKENETAQKTRADKLQEIVEKLEDMLQRLNDSTASISPMKQPHPAPRNHIQLNTAGDLLEKQNKNLEEKLSAVREEMIVERQAARTAHLSLWKVEKKLEETEAQNKMLQRRMELTEDRIKKARNERDEAQRICKLAQDETRQREERIQELKDEIANLKLDLQKEHKLWEKAEQERMKTKSEVFEHISNSNKLREQLAELKKCVHQAQTKNDGLSIENRRLISELNKEREMHATTTEKSNELDMQLKNVQLNFEQLKYAFKLTDEQFGQVEEMLKSEQERNKSQQDQIKQFYEKVHQKDDTIAKLQKDLNEEIAQRQNAESRIRAYSTEIEENKANINDLQSRLVLQQQQLMEQTSQLFNAQERIEVLSTEAKSLHTVNENFERELILLKEEGSCKLSDLFHIKQELEQTQNALKEAQSQVADLQMELDEIRAILSEKEEYYAQRDVKTETTLAQYKKLIDYLQLKVSDLTQKAKKKTFTDMLFGSGSTSAAGSKKDTFSMEDVQSTIFYRVLQEELEREKQISKTLKEQIEKLKGNKTMNPRSPLKSMQSQQNKENIEQNGSSVKTTTTSSKDGIMRNEERCHHFELAKQPFGEGVNNCVACSRAILAPSAYFKCKNCKTTVHRKCRGDVSNACAVISTAEIIPSAPPIDKKDIYQNQEDTNSIGKYSYEGKLDPVDGSSDGIVSSLSCMEAHHRNYSGTLVLDLENHKDKLEVNAAYEIIDDSTEKNRTLLLGCISGLYAYQIATQKLLHIAGIDLVNNIAVSAALAKAILIAGNGESLYQCDFRQLISRTQQTSNTLVKAPALEASLLDLPFANRTSGEKWQLVAISNECENALDSVAIAGTSSRIVILKYDLKIMKFKPVRALDTATPVSSILYTRHTAIVASDKFFEIDLNTYAAEEFVDISDQSLAHTHSCTPIVAIRISPQEFLLCFMECGVFVDDFGCRSRPYDLNWEYTPTGFMYREPFLYIAHFQSLQIVRLVRSCSKHLSAPKDSETEGSSEHIETSASPTFKRVYLPFYMPKLLAESGKVNAYTLALNKINGLQQIHHIDAFLAFKNQLNESQETLTSIGTALSSINTFGETSDFSN